MKIGLIDVDGRNFPNLALMKLSTYHKAKCDEVVWYDMFTGHCDKVYKAKVFSFTPDYEYAVDADEVIEGGTGYAFTNIEHEQYHRDKDIPLPDEIEHLYPDYSIYYDLIPKTKNTAYGFLTRGCPRGCHFCIVGEKETRKVHKVADLSEWWNGQVNIELIDPNILACKEAVDLLDQLIQSKASVNFNQGLDIRLMTPKRAELIGKIKKDKVHFAWDNYNDKDVILTKLKEYKEITNCDRRKTIVYMLTNYNSTFEQDLERIETLKSVGFNPFVMIYEKYKLSPDSNLIKLQRWVNNRFIFEACNSFKEYLSFIGV